MHLKFNNSIVTMYTFIYIYICIHICILRYLYAVAGIVQSIYVHRKKWLCFNWHLFYLRLSRFICIQLTNWMWVRHAYTRKYNSKSIAQLLMLPRASSLSSIFVRLYRKLNNCIISNYLSTYWSIKTLKTKLTK